MTAVAAILHKDNWDQIMTCAVFYLAGCLACQAPQTNPKPTAEIQSVDHLTPALRIAAGRLDAPPASPLFSALAERKGDASVVGLSKDQLQLVLEMDATARKTLRHWLVQPRAEGSPILKVEDLDRARAFVVGHMEAILFECVLTPRQAGEWHKIANKPIQPPREGRYIIIPPTSLDEPPPRTKEECLEEIRNLASSEDSWKGEWGGCSEILRLVLDSIRPTHWDPLPELTAQQKELTKAINAVACDAQKLWLLRGIVGMPMDRPLAPEQWLLPPTPAMVSRLSESGRRLRQSVMSHAEEIVLEAVLDPGRQIESKRRFWIDRGPRALLDPELRATLRLAKWQQDMLKLMLEERVIFWDKANNSRLGVDGEGQEFFSRILAPGHLKTPDEEERARMYREASNRRFEERMANFDAAIWDILSTPQSRTLAKILRKPIPKKESEKTKKKSSRAG